MLNVMSFATIPEAIEELRAGRMLVVVDDEDRENEGDLTMAADCVTPEAINFMATHGRGLICLALTPERCDALHLPLVSPKNTSRFGTAFCESIDATHGVTTGISAGRPALHTIRVAMQPSETVGPGASGPFSLACARRRGVSACGPDRGIRRLGAHGGLRAGRGDLRNHECRRLHGACPATG